MLLLGLEGGSCSDELLELFGMLIFSAEFRILEMNRCD